MASIFKKQFNFFFLKSLFCLFLKYVYVYNTMLQLQAYYDVKVKFDNYEELPTTPRIVDSEVPKVNLLDLLQSVGTHTQRTCMQDIFSGSSSNLIGRPSTAQNIQNLPRQNRSECTEKRIFQLDLSNSNDYKHIVHGRVNLGTQFYISCY